MSIKKQILELCEEVVKNGSCSGVDCDGISCIDCPLSDENRIDGMGCVDRDKATVRIAKEYINKIKSCYTVKEIIENISLFEVGTRFSLFGKNILSIGENETIIFEGSMSNELDLNLVLEIERPKKERIVTFEELKVGDIFILRKKDTDSYLIRKVISRVNEDVFVVQYAETVDALDSDNTNAYDVFLKDKVIDWDIVLLEEQLKIN